MERRRYDDEDRGRDRERGRDRDDRDDRRESRDRREERGRDRDRDDDDRGSRRSSRDRDDDDRGSSRWGSRRFEYQERDPSMVREREQSNSKFDQYLPASIKMWKPNDGDNCVRILPPTWEGAKHYGVDVWVHYGVGADRQTYICPEKHDKGKCPVCEERRDFGRDADMDDESDKAHMRDLDARQRVLVYLIDRDHEREGVQAWMMPASLDSDIVKITKDKRTGEVLSIDHPDKGYDITFEKNGSGKKTKYEAPAIARNSSPLGKDEWLDYAMDHPLPDQLIIFDYDHIAREFGGVVGDRKEDKGRDRDRDDRGGRDRDRDDDRRGRDRDDDREERGRGRDRDDDDRGGSRRGEREERGRNEEPDLSWADVHEMTARELDDLIESKKLKVNPDKTKDDEELADLICEELGIDKPSRRRERDDDSSDTKDRLSKLRDRIRD